MPSRDNRYKKSLYKPNMNDEWFDDKSISKKLFDYIVEVVPKGGTVLELGSGWATGELAKHFKMYSVEHDEQWVGKYDSTYLYVPLKEHKPLANHKDYIWYDADILREKLSGLKYDLLLIDGPPKTRSGFYKYHDLFDASVIWVFDDISSEGDRKVISSCATRLLKPFVSYYCEDGKPFVVFNDPYLQIRP